MTVTYRDPDSYELGHTCSIHIPKYGHFPMLTYREKLGLESVETIRDRILAFAAWKKRQEIIKLQATAGMATRARTNNNIPAPDQRGWRGKMVLTKISQIWNKIPNNIKMEDKAHLAKKHIKKLF